MLPHVRKIYISELSLQIGIPYKFLCRLLLQVSVYTNISDFYMHVFRHSLQLLRYATLCNGI
uniref:Uncharacterized protein n=1 Tax=Arundo donax TaxID=35708 RepID=A0A0A9HRC4_ARUDO